MVEMSRVTDGCDHERPFPLSIHASGMLEIGISKYIDATADLYAGGKLDAVSCVMRTVTAREVCEKLRAWAVSVDPGYLRGTIRWLRQLEKECKSQRKRFGRLAVAEVEACRREKTESSAHPSGTEQCG